MLGYPKTRGSILLISTLILSMLAGLSIATLQNVVTEYKLTTQNQDYNLALSAAQYAVAEAKRLLLTNWSPGAPSCASVVGCTPSNGIAVWSYNAFAGSPDFSQQPLSYFNNAQATPNVPNPQVAAAPRFFVIDLGCDPYSKVNVYRIIAIGFGASLKTVAYVNSQLTMPLSGQNSYAGAQSQTVPALLNGNPISSYQLVPSSSRAALFFNTAGGGTCNNSGQSLSTGATCEMNCAGEVRVKGYSSFNDSKCPWYYGDWVSNSTATNTSTLTLASNAGGGTTTVACKAANSGACPAGQAFNGTCCAGSCSGGQSWSCNTASCTCPVTGQTWNGTCCAIACSGGRSWDCNSSSCVCPNGSNWNGSSCVTCTGGRTWNGTACVCSAGRTWNGACCAGTCTNKRVWNCNSSSCVCPSGSWNGSCCETCRNYCNGARHPTCHRRCDCI